MTSSPNTEQLARLEARLQELEDIIAITQLIASYGPRVDSGDADAVAAMWTPDGEYDVEGWHMRDREEVRAMVHSTPHQKYIGRGSLHFMAPASVSVDGDTAIAICESLLVLHRDGVFTIARGGANRIELARTSTGWQITRRTTRTLDGAAQARELLAPLSPGPS